MGNNEFLNHEGYADPTAYHAVKNVERKETVDEDYERFKKWLNTIFLMSEMCGFHIEERMVVKDVKTGKVYR